MKTGGIEMNRVPIRRCTSNIFYGHGACCPLVPEHSAGGHRIEM